MGACQRLGTFYRFFRYVIQALVTPMKDFIAKNMTKKQNRGDETKTKMLIKENDRQPDGVRLPVELKSLGFPRLL